MSLYLLLLQYRSHSTDIFSFPSLFPLFLHPYLNTPSSQLLSLPFCLLSPLPVFEVFPDPTATYGERERASDSLRLREREHIAWSVRSYKGLSAAGWLVVRIEKYMTDFLVNYPKWESRKCCLSLSHADKHISHCIFFFHHTFTRLAPWVLILLSLSLSLHILTLLHQHTLLHTRTKTFKVTLLKHLL